MTKQDIELKILKITDGKAGHITITDGVIEAIQKHHQVQIIELQVTLRVKFFLTILKLIFNDDWLSEKMKNFDWLIAFFYKNYEKPTQQVDLIISSGGDTSFINIWLADILDVKNIYCSGLRGIKPERFSLIISTLELDLKNSIKLEVAPTKVGSHNLSNDVIKFCEDKRIDKKEKYFVLLIGGNGAGYKYRNKDFENLVKHFMNLVIKNSAKALITTSRRTGIENEKFLKEQFSKYHEHIAYNVYFNQNPEKVVAIYLDLASAVFVTEESGSMITESLFCKKPLFTVRPKQVMDQERYRIFLDDLFSKHRMIRLNAEDDWSTINLNEFDFSYIEKTPIDDLSEKIQPYLKELIS
jgi:mitochondrial fission protein ELM1